MNDEMTIIKTNLNYRNIENKQRSILVTGDLPGCGKSTFSILLAGVMASPEKKVVLIDGDLRKPTLHQKLRLYPQKGLVDCLLAMDQNDFDLNDFIIPSKYDNVDFISFGQVPQRPVDFFESDQFNKLLRMLEEKYRYVIIDAPPVRNMADPYMIGTKVDGIIFVVRYGVSRIDRFTRTLRDFEPLKNKILGLVISQKKHRMRTYYYNYYSGYGSYGGYGREKKTRHWYSKFLPHMFKGSHQKQHTDSNKKS